MDFRLPEKVNTIIKTLKNAGFEAYAVGGCVRDLILNRRPNDWDITTNAVPAEVKKLFRRTFDTGIEHGTVTVMLGEDHFEVTTYRLDGKYSDLRHPDEVRFTGSLTEDLKRRDFTVNALAYNEEDGLRDEFGGREDLKNGVIRAVGNAKERFSEDALRILRAFRFAAQLDFSIEEETLRAAKELKGNLKAVSAERIMTEFTKLLCSGHPELIRSLYETGITEIILPEADICFKTDQRNKHHMYTVGEHTIRALMADACELEKTEAEYVTEDEWREFLEVYEKIRRLPGIYDERADRYVRYALLFHDFGKPACMKEDEEGNRHFKGHAIESERISQDVLTRLKSDNDTKSMVGKLVLYHDYRPDPDKRSVRRAINKIGKEAYLLLFRVRVADTLAQSAYNRPEKLKYEKKVMLSYLDITDARECVSIKDLAVNGKDLMEKGMEPGPELGDKLKELLEIVLENPECNTREYLLSRL